MTAPRVGRPKGENTDNTNRRRKQIMDAAIKSIVENGFSATTLATVSKASGLSQGTTVFYFKNKKSLLLETFSYRLKEFRAYWMDALSTAGPDPVDRIMVLIFASTSAQILTRQNMIFWNSFWNEASINTSIAEMSNRYDAERLGLLLSLCEDAKDQIKDTIWTPKIVAHTLETMTDGIWSRMYFSPDYTNIKDARMALGTVLSSVFPSRTEDIMARAVDYTTLKHQTE